jgi:hypothetical protein
MVPHRLPQPLLELLFHLLDHRPDHHPGRLLGPLRDAALERHEGADELDVRLHALERLRLEEELREPFPLDGVGLDDGDDVLLEVGADVAEPLGQPRGGRAQPGRPLFRGVVLVGHLVVDGGEGLVHLGVPAGQAAPAHAVERGLGVLAEDQPPTAELVGVRYCRHGKVPLTRENVLTRAACHDRSASSS